MKFVLANWGTRGEVEPFIAIARELVHRGHDAHLVVGPELVGFAESAGLSAVAFGPALDTVIEAHHEYWSLVFSKPWRVQEMNKLLNEFAAPLIEYREQARETLLALSAGADLLVSGMNYEEVASNVAEYCGTALATLQVFPLRVNGFQLPFLPVPVCRSVMAASEWLTWRGHKAEDDAERNALGLPEATGHWTQRIAALDAMEIQAYDAVCYPGLADEWASWNDQKIPKRPFIGALTMGLAADEDVATASWIAAGTPPIFFGFGSMPVGSAADAVAMIAGACAQLGERALIGAGWADFGSVPEYDHVKIVGAINYAEVFPSCRAVVHHGGAGTVHAGLRAGRPTLLLWMLPDQACWASRLKKLKVGAGRRFVATTEKSLVADLRKILAPDYLDRAQQLAARMTKPAESVVVAADLMESFALSRRA
ncbi:glycosyltransferase [Mycolicibacterium holsaticum]|uniref:glycosyltransferase n=1 Tax=Mycolicibacterium holsaticum TaxID=152142 RepID=UPI001C7DE7BD|nr:glycosyltransferase [Mycolicibacterium holsaticum]MDA4110878.1 glycosyl transferase family 1 [Mycolicibacterium holsaticum DSM 44478 = JCM 12374]QZA12178.1 glycosyltransferase [Mycolicibacterium holsaticum DSM 44478 = JCM 12374]UNC10336.1 glycosyltransferase [Mycolicibacterium holsaticum DSM 44478 = JCM 12374]